MFYKDSRKWVGIIDTKRAVKYLFHCEFLVE